MKLSHKLIMVSAAALMAVSPVVVSGGSIQAANTKTAKTNNNAKTSKTNAKSVKAAKTKAKTTKITKSKAKKAAANTNIGNTIVLARNSYVYLANGKRNTNYKYNGKSYPVIGKGASLQSSGTVTIKGKVYYNIGNGNFIKAANVATVNGKKAPKVKASSKSKLKSVTLSHNSYVYDKKGKRIKNVKTLKKDAVVPYVGTKTIKGKKYYNLGKGQYIKASNVVTPEEDAPVKEDTYIKLIKNSIIYNEDGEKPSDSTTLSKGAEYIALDAKEINGKWYYQIGTTDVGTQWIRAINAIVESGPKLITDPDFVEPTDPATKTPTDGTVITLKNPAQAYNSKGAPIVNNTFNQGYSLRVNSMVWIWVPAEKQAVEFYKIDSASDAYIKASDVSEINGAPLNPTNTEEQAKQAGTIATAADKTNLNALITEANNVKNTDLYKNATDSYKLAYDSAISKGQSVANSSTSTVLDVNNAASAISKAKSDLNGTSQTTTTTTTTTTTNPINSITTTN